METAAVQYRVSYSDGRKAVYDTMNEAYEAIRSEYAEMVVDGEVEQTGQRVLVWACEADSVDDDGRRAIASITGVWS